MQELINLLPHIIVVAIFLYFAIKYIKKLKPAKLIDEKVESEPDLDLKTLPLTHYLLESGKRTYRLSDNNYDNPDNLVLYTLGIIFNNDVENYDKVLLKSLGTRIRIYYLLQHYTDEKNTIYEKMQALAEHFFMTITELSEALQNDYALPTQKDEAIPKLVKVFTLILDSDEN